MRRYIPAITMVIFVAIVFFVVNTPVKIVNIHESIESPAEVETLLAVMEKTGIDEVVLHGVPYELLHYGEDSTITYTNLEENNSYLLEASQKYPDKISYFCGINSSSFEALEQIDDCLANGAKGIKLYSGYSFFNNGNFDSAEYLKIYEKISLAGAILMMPVNTEKFAGQLENILTINPDLKFICSHYCLSSKDLHIIDDLMARYPNLYVDTSFGHLKYAQDGFKTISDSHENFTKFFEKYQDRILFATDNVVTNYENKDVERLSALYNDYVSILKNSEFESKSNPNPGVVFQGLNLSSSILKKVLWNNWHSLL